MRTCCRNYTKDPDSVTSPSSSSPMSCSSGSGSEGASSSTTMSWVEGPASPPSSSRKAAGRLPFLHRVSCSFWNADLPKCPLHQVMSLPNPLLLRSAFPTPSMVSFPLLSCSRLPSLSPLALLFLGTCSSLLGSPLVRSPV
jgi:hypothetical protein